MAKSSAQKKVKEQAQTEVKNQTTATENSGDAPLEPIQLTLADLQQLSRIIDLASRRGAFQAGELAQVGATFNRLTGFLAYVQAMQEKEDLEKAKQEKKEETA